MLPSDTIALPPQLPVPPPPAPWGFWPTLGLTALALAILFLAQALVSIVYFAALWLADPSADPFDLAEGLGRSGLMFALAGLAGAPAGIAAVWFFARLRRGIAPLVYLGLQQFPFGLSFGWLIVLGFYQMLVAVAAAAVQPADNATSQFMLDAFSSAEYRPLLWLAVVIVIPCAEELLFRGFMFRGLLHSRAGAAGAVLIPAVVWGVIHLQYDLFGIVSLMGMGVILGLARLATGSTWTPLGMHVAWNGMATLGMELHVRGYV